MAKGKGEYKGTNVQSLNKRDFTIKGDKVYVKAAKFKGNVGVIKLYAPWCPHCQNMVKPLSKLADVLKPYAISVGAVDCDNTRANNNVLAEKLGLEGFPTMYIVKKNGRLMQHDGPNDNKALINGMQRYT